MSRWQLALALCLTLVAFAANSVLCRLALSGAAADAAGFTTLRLVSGALVLVIITKGAGLRVTWHTLLPAGALFVYAAGFSYAYLDLSAGTGALLLFGAVQFTMLVGGLAQGERPSPLAWLGWILATIGLVYLLLPGLQSPPIGAAGLMIVAGIAWGAYSLVGRSNTEPVLATARNFTFACVPALLLLPVNAICGGEPPVWQWYAVASGAITSALGYVLWYMCLRRISSISAAIAQLSVPLIAALGGVLVLSESLTTRLLIGGLLILGGISIGFIEKKN